MFALGASHKCITDVDNRCNHAAGYSLFQYHTSSICLTCVLKSHNCPRECATSGKLPCCVEDIACGQNYKLLQNDHNGKCLTCVSPQHYCNKK